MALIACGECGQTVSTTAVTCPGCGAGRKDFKRQPGERRRMSGCAIIAIAFVILLVVAGLLSKLVPPTPTQPLDEVTRDRQRAAYQAARSIKAAAREPESVTFERILADEHGQTVCLTYRGRNGFGGMTRERVTVRDGVGSTRARDWNRHCAGRRMYNLTGVRRVIS